MRASDLNPLPDLSIPTLPVICDKCRTTGMAGDAAFSAIPDILAFAPVPIRARADGWTEHHQRAFIAGLAITGSPRQAARAIGRHAFGAERLRYARGGREFALAWDAAVELARDRETHRIHANLADLAAQRDAEIASAGPPGDSAASPAPMRAEDSPYIREVYGESYDPGEYLDGHAEVIDALGMMRDKMLRARRWLLADLAEDEDSARRDAWEVLAGPVDWDRARAMEPQDNEPGQGTLGLRPQLPNMLQPDMQLTHDAGLLGEFTGVGVNLHTELRQAAVEELARRAKLEAPPRNGEGDRPEDGGGGSDAD